MLSTALDIVGDVLTFIGTLWPNYIAPALGINLGSS